MSWKKIAIIGGIVVVVVAIVGFTVQQSQKNVVEVQIGKVERRDLSSTVTASGEIKPKTFVNISANSFGRILKLYVHEGERVKRGQLLAQLENVQSASDVAAMRSSLEATRTDAVAADAGYSRSKADAERTKLDWERAEGLYKQGLIPKSEYDSRKSAYASADAALAQTKAQRESAQGRVGQARATLTGASDRLSKTSYVAPFDGVITNLPVREGENVVIGIQNAPGSTLMTIADLSVITAEVKVDETDIVNVKLGQPAEVTIDAIPNKVFAGKVTEIGNNAIIRSTGISTQQTTVGSQEAKDFKVVVTLDNPPENLRPGLSTTAKVTTATKTGILAIPIQALTIRSEDELKATSEKDKGSVQAAAAPKAGDKKKEEIQGVFVVGTDKKAKFVKVETGITGTTDIEVVSGLKDGDEIVTGSYKVLRTLRNGAGVKKEKVEAKKEGSAS
jgi:HlyD family secretion protein